MKQAVERFNEVLKEEGLVIYLQDMNVRELKDGGVLVEKPVVTVMYTPEKQKELESLEVTQPNGTETTNGETASHTE